MKGICPYPGLRPFTEEESIFFKGRDQHIRQIVRLLEKNKMAFITGASGDGKSSMVYAGVIPYIRAGFFKAKFNGWLIVDFKPQKNPLKSLSEAFARELDMDEGKCEAELYNGFSSLVDLYKESGYCVGDDGDDISNRGKSLLIIADQFEEVFTNIDNFDQGHPSDEAYTAVNLLLETIRISINENLPVFVIFTMRSDFISQCTFFKNLPEYIAYSQFFVPQLKRTEIRQVIEEPALMAGGKIAPRLIEVIINNLTSGFDQLPMLQHALNLLWRVADNGAIEIDLIHLAKIAGISSDSLSADDKGEFDRWFNNLPDYQRKYYDKPDLNNVLNAHAGILYESAYDYFMQNADWAEKSITPEESKEIIETVFKSLTKIDNNRPVRNRCTLSEITGIINKEHITNATVCGVINIFRTQENALVKPFSIKGNTETEYLSGDTVLDVTHEALIRNWKLLSEWDIEEATDMKDFHDLNTQMQLWIRSDKQSEYLLNSGSYMYFNQWFKRSNPNPYLFVKYDNSHLPQRQKIKHAQYKYENYIDFLEASNAAILAKEKAVRKRVRIIMAALLAFILSLSGLVYWAMDEKQNAEDQMNIANSEREYAKEQQRKADDQRKKAESANKALVEERAKAEQAADKAIKAKNQIAYALRLAEQNRLEAERQRGRADSSLALAEAQRDSAQRDRERLEAQILQTNEANAKAERFNMMAMSNLLAMKAKNIYEDKMMNLRLVMTAYKMAIDNNVDNSAELYDAMLFAMEQNGMIQPMKTTGNKIIKFAIDDTGDVVCITQNAQILVYSQALGKSKEIKRLTKFESKAAVTHAIFLDPDNVIYSTADRNTYHIKIKTEERFKLSSYGDVIKAACITMDAQKIIVAYEGGRIVVLDSKETNGRLISSLNLKTKLLGICCAPNSNDVYILTAHSELYKWNIKDDRQRMIFANKEQNASCIVSIPDKRQAAVCFSNGNIEFVDMITDTRTDAMLGGHSEFQEAVYDTPTGYLMISSHDKRITVIKTRSLEEKPVVIEEHSLNRSKILSFGLADGGTIYALTDDNMIRYFNLDIDANVAEISKQMPPLLKQEELELILGRDFLKKL
jgi:hypothetical protein